MKQDLAVLGTFSLLGFSVNELTGVIVAVTNLLYIVYRFVKKETDKDIYKNEAELEDTNEEKK